MKGAGGLYPISPRLGEAMAKQYRSETMAAIHETAEGLHSIGLMDKQTIRKFDEACLTPVRPLTAAEIRALREREGASQAVFRPLPQRRHGAPVGAGRKAPAGSFAQTALPCSQEWAWAVA